ncbi:MAG TPA: methylated-DNA--[protein]-cysteine S-methyltransferase [Burkholderiaceae bacterium]
MNVQCRIDTPLGTMIALRTDQGLAGLWFDGQKHQPDLSDVPQGDDPLFEQLRAELRRYFAGQPLRGDLKFAPQGTAFQQAVWRELLAIPLGGHTSYGQIAARLKRPSAARAVGAAVGRNPISILIPCHRVLGAGGQLTGYAGGLPRKVALLEIESTPQARQAA